MKKLNKWTVLMAVLTLVLVGMANMNAAEGAFTSKGINVMTPTEEAIRKHSGHQWSVTEYEVLPNLTAPYNAGRLSEDTLEEALDVLNLMRFIAGIPDEVELNTAYNMLAQSAALINRVNNKMSSNPEKPADMQQSMYALCAEGARTSNLGQGYEDLPTAILEGWMYDGDRNNSDTVGHRRWILNLSMEEVGFGQVDNQTAMYAFDNMSEDTDYYGVAWPAQLMPYEFFTEDEPWSISMGYMVNSDATVKLKRVNDGKTWEFNSKSKNFYIENSKYGCPGCIIFRPDGIGQYKPGDIFEVTITGSNIDVAYEVKFFSLYDNSIDANVTDIVVDQSFLHMYTSTSGVSSAKLTATIFPINSKARINWTSSDSNVVLIGQDGIIYAVGSGTAMVTASAGVYMSSCQVLVTNNINDAEVTCYPVNNEYTGKAVKPVITLKYQGRMLTEGKDYSLSYENNTAVGTGLILYQGIGEFSGEGFTEFSIVPITITESMVSDIPEQRYTGQTIIPEVLVTYKGKKLIRGTDYDLFYYGNVDAGIATVEVTGKGNYDGMVMKHFGIQKYETEVIADSQTESTRPEDTEKTPEPVVSEGSTATVTEAGEQQTAEPVKQKITVKTSSKTLKYSDLKKKSVSFKMSIKTTVDATVQYKLTASTSPYINISKKGTVTVSKGIKKGTYQITVKITAKANEQATAATRTVKVKIKIK